MNQSEYERLRERDKALEAKKNKRNSKHWLVLEAWAKELGWQSGAEIGVARGWTFCHLLDTVPGLSMIAVDQWLDSDITRPGHDSYTHMVPEYCALRVKERAAKYGGRARVIHAPSIEAAAQVEDESLDFCFIDDDHSYEGCKASIRAWAPKVKLDGWVTGHDWDRPEVVQAIDELLPGWEGLAPPARAKDKCWRIRKADVDGLSL